MIEAKKKTPNCTDLLMFFIAVFMQNAHHGFPAFARHTGFPIRRITQVGAN